MKEIRNVVVIGMGALGLLFGQRIQSGVGREHMCFLMDAARKHRHEKDVYTINGEPVSFSVKTPQELTEAPDLVVIATKYSGLHDAREMIRDRIDGHTILVSLLNGISSEEILAEAIPREQILDCVAIRMDPVREGSALRFENRGGWQIGSSVPGQEEALRTVTDFLDRVGIAYEAPADIRRAMWNKYMINVGINQTCMVYDTDYAGALQAGPALDDLLGAMRETMAVAAAEGVTLTEEDLQADLAILRSLNPRSYPSMRQDALAGRKTEVELFSGTLIRLAEGHGIEVPVNRKYYRAIKAKEAALDAAAR